MKKPDIKKIARLIQNTVIVGLALLIIYFGVSFAFNFMQTDIGETEVLLNMLELRTSSKGLVERSKLITQTNELVDSMRNKEIRAGWDRLAVCLGSKCSDEDYLAFIETVVKEDKPKNRDLILNLIKAKRNWNGADLITFSKSIAAIDSEIKNSPPEVYKRWQELVACDGKCSGMNDLLFEMIRLSLQIN